MDNDTFKEINYKFQVKGHTKNSVDQGFAYVKTLYSRNNCWSLDNYVEIVNQSATTNNGSSVEDIEFNDWTSYLHQFYKPFVGIQQFQMFKFVSSDKGMVYAKKLLSDTWVTIKIARENPHIVNDTPPIIAPRGLSAAKQTEMYEVMRKYAPARYKDTVCPAPDAATLTAAKKQKSKKQKENYQKCKNKKGTNNKCKAKRVKK